MSLAALYAKIARIKPALLRALVRGSAERLLPLADCLPKRESLPGWQLRVFDDNHLPASEKRLEPLRDLHGAALPGHTLVVYDPDSTLVCDIVACEDAYEIERTAALTLIESAQAKQVWISDRHFCTQAILEGLAERGAGFIVREHALHPRLQASGKWGAKTDTASENQFTHAPEHWIAAAFTRFAHAVRRYRADYRAIRPGNDLRIED